MTKIISLISVLLLLSSCITTSKLWEEKGYHENIKQFSYELNGDKLIAIGDKYHYIFEGQADLIKIFNSDFQKQIEPDFGKFHAEKDKISGEFTLVIDYSERTSSNHRKYRPLLDNGFKRSRQGFSKKYSIKGKRYIKSKSQNDIKSYDKPYRIHINEKDSLGKKAYNLAASPITITIDGIAAPKRMVDALKFFAAFGGYR